MLRFVATASLPKAVAALAIGLAIALMPLAAIAHEGHSHPPAKSKKAKKTKAPKQSGIHFAVRPATG